jgi:hypothetical protein
MIIIEGTDGVGKTSFCRKLADEFVSQMGSTAAGWYNHMSRPPENFNHVAGYMRMVRAGVQDRFHLGSIVYGKILGCGCYPTPRKMALVQRYLEWQGCYIVVMRAERDWLKRELLARPDLDKEMYQLEQILDANDAFTALSNSHNRDNVWAHEVIDVTDGWPGAVAATRIFDIWKARWQR